MGQYGGVFYVLCCLYSAINKTRLHDIDIFIFKNSIGDLAKSFSNYFLWMDDPCNLRCFVMFILRT